MADNHELPGWSIDCDQTRDLSAMIPLPHNDGSIAAMLSAYGYFQGAEATRKAQETYFADRSEVIALLREFFTAEVKCGEEETA